MFAVFAQQSLLSEQPQTLLKTQQTGISTINLQGQNTTLNSLPSNELLKIREETLERIRNDSILMRWHADSLRLVDSLRVAYGDTAIKMNLDTAKKQLFFDDFANETKYFERLNRKLFKDSLKVFGEDFFYMATELLVAPNIGPVNFDYKLGVGDEIIIQIWGDVQITESLIVGRNGTITPTGIGQINVAGLSIKDVKKTLLQKFSKIYSGVKNGAANATTFVDVTTGNLRQKSIIVVGEVQFPGNYLIPSTAGVISAIAKAGGPTENASLRNVVIRRSGADKTDSVDLYGYFLTGKITDTTPLADFDVILVNPVDKRVAIDGAVRRPAQYELKDGETFADLFKFCGGLLPEAFTKNMTVERTDPGIERQSYTLKEEEVVKLYPQKSDYVFIDFVDKLDNTVSIEGAIKRPGFWSFEEGMKISDLVERAGGVLEEFFGDRVVILRTHENMKKETLSANIKKILDGEPQYDLPLQKWDVVKISSIWDFLQKEFIEVYGEVKNPGKYFLREGMTVQDVILLAGGFTQEAYQDTVEISRIVSSNINKGNKINYERINISADFFKLSTNELKHADVIFIRKDAKKKPQEIVYLDGEFCFPGYYAKIDEKESVFNLIKRAGGFKESAYLEGVTFKRSKDSIGRVGIDFYSLFTKNNKNENIILEHGDSIFAPTLPKTVNIIGSVNNPTATKYLENKSIGHYINRAGGLTLLGKRGVIYVMRANGEVRQVKLRTRNTVNAGSEIFVVDGLPPREKNPQLIVSVLATIVSTMALVTTTVSNVMK
jgi:protein involved in polysaccharide export with SLBB domain